MGWTHDYRDVARNPRDNAEQSAPAVALPDRSHVLGIPRILGRRARWVGARLRHTAARN